MSEGDPRSRLRDLPSVHALVEDEALSALVAHWSRPAVVEAARAAVDRARGRLLAGEEARVGPDEVEDELHRLFGPRLRPVLNATGVVLHTNLGRAPLAPVAVEAMVRVASTYTNLELRLEDGSRGGRDEGLERHVVALTGAEAAFAVNNGAGAALLALAAVAAGREVVVSRGELVEIGGGFRVPEVLAQSGARLVEVGTTNRTRAADYATALGPATGAILKVHPSNFALVGFTEAASIAELVPLARGAGARLVYDQGSGELDDVRSALEAGADLVTFSGDKLLAGPQAGLVVGRRDAVEAARRHPLARALRLDRLRLAALERTLVSWRTGRTRELPAARMLAEEPDVVGGRASLLAATIGPEAVVARVEGATGGGARPDRPLDSFAVVLAHETPEALAQNLRIGEPAVLARVARGAVLLDCRTLADRDVMPVATAVRQALAALARAAGGAGLRPVESDVHEGEAPGRVLYES